MTDKVRIDTLGADLLDANNDTFLARQAEFESNVRSYPRKLPLAITKAEGVWLTDADNKQYLDCLAGAGTLALGHNHPDVLQSIQSVITSGLPLHTLDLTTPLKDRFSEYLLSLLPGEGKEYCLQFTGPSGADAVEAALKLAKKYTGRTSVISFSGGYHGMTSGFSRGTYWCPHRRGLFGVPRRSDVRPCGPRKARDRRLRPRVRRWSGRCFTTA